jgi:L-lactate dehydrogenase complex protein LldG
MPPPVAPDGWIPLPAFTGWGYSKDFPKPEAKPFRERFGKGVDGGNGKLGQEKISALDNYQSTNLPTTNLPISESINLLEKFTTELTALGGQVYNVSSDSLTQQLIDFLTQRGIDRVEMWDQVPKLDSAHLAEAGIRVVGSPASSRGTGAPDLAVGITGALCAVAETGSLLVPGGAGQPLTASLVPPVHVAVIHASQILPTLEEALRLPEVTATPAGAIVTGPSRTADIEMTLTIGVHGPGEVHVFIVDDVTGQ